MKVILDTDIGDDIDDAWALAFVIAHRKFEPLGITVTHGNTPARARMACKMLHLTGRDSIPVFVGRQTGQEEYSYQFTWAEDFTTRAPASSKAADFIVETVRRYPDQVTLIAVGLLQNLADARRKEPQLGKLVKRVVLMGGCVYGTAENQAPIAEYNVYSSIEDSQLVYGAGLPLTIVPLDSTTHVKHPRCRARPTAKVPVSTDLCARGTLPSLAGEAAVSDDAARPTRCGRDCCLEKVFRKSGNVADLGRRQRLYAS